MVMGAMYASLGSPSGCKHVWFDVFHVVFVLRGTVACKHSALVTVAIQMSIQSCR